MARQPRNEATKLNRTLRFASFEILLKLGELQQVAFHVHYDKDFDKPNPCIGRAYTLTINDLSQVLPNSAQVATGELLKVWSNNAEKPPASKDSLDPIILALGEARDQTLDFCDYWNRLRPVRYARR
jgi:hypothetical protein